MDQAAATTGQLAVFFRTGPSYALAAHTRNAPSTKQSQHSPLRSNSFPHQFTPHNRQLQRTACHLSLCICFLSFFCLFPCICVYLVIFVCLLFALRVCQFSFYPRSVSSTALSCMFACFVLAIVLSAMLPNTNLGAPAMILNQSKG